MTNSRLETVILDDSFERARKNFPVEKKIMKKTDSKKKVMINFLKIFIKKISKVLFHF